ncbi:hypothetical protein [Methanolobus profundi]|uniref:Uncharacterized protein n=1 Tax=Methanolobus profundi TaxID=487685 RepID=A0A1I4S4D5_9EURY|nr:hypothetical protein [Methanolobus profundi]SFM59347.1 hypothetical protein SAMN04488696_1767 [Methanolobus profundi]
MDSRKVLIAALLAIVLLSSAFLIYISPLYSGQIAPLYSVHNSDANEHTVTVEVLNSHNKSIIEETYTLNYTEYAREERPFLSTMPLSSNKFTFNVTLDGENMGSYPIEVELQNTMGVVALYDDYPTGNVTPVSVYWIRED